MSSSAPTSSIDQEVDVAIVGAGISGLCAATEIKKTDPSASLVILEANSRVGGRNFVDAEGTDLGAGYLGVGQDRILKVVDSLGLETYKVSSLTPGGKTTSFVSGRATHYSGTIPPLSPLGLLDLNNFMVALDAICSLVNAEKPHLTPNAEELDSITMAAFIQRHCWTSTAAKMVRTALNAVIAVEPCEVSVLFFAWYCVQSGGIKRILEGEGGAQDSKIKGGTGRISLELAKRLPESWLRLSTAVRDIDVTNSSKQEIILRCSSTAADNAASSSSSSFVVKAKTIIVAIPPVQQLRINWLPAAAMHPNRHEALQHCPMKHYCKTHLFYERPFWRDFNLNGSIVGDQGVVKVSLDDSKPDGSSFAIMGFVLSQDAQKWTSLKTKDERQKAIAEHYARIFASDEALKPIAYKEKIWAAEPWIGGGATAIPTPGILTKFVDSIHDHEPMTNVFVAGTESARRFVGYMDGAVEAGERSARNALVRLGRLPEAEFEKVSEPGPSKQMPFVEMELSWAEKHLVPSVPQALVIGGAVLSAAGYAAWKYFKK